MLSCYSEQPACSWRSAAVTFLILASTIPAVAQRGRRDQAPPPPQAEQEVRVSSRPYIAGLPPTDELLIPVGVAVRDNHGRAIESLKAADFQLTDQGKEVAIAGVNPINRVKTGSTAAKTPRYIALCFDDYGATQGQLLRAKSIAIQFVKDGLGPDDLASVGSTFSKRLTDFTSDKAKLQGAIERLEQHATPSIAPPTRVQTGAAPGGAIGTSSNANRAPAIAQGADLAAAGEFISRAFLDLIASYDNDLSHMPGSRAILLLSPGFLGMPEHEQDQVITKTLAAGVVINALDSKSGFREMTSSESEAGYSLPPASYNFEVTGLGIEASMAEFAHSTGGLFFHHDGDPFSHGYHELGDVPEISYVLALHPQESDVKYHRLKVQLKSPGSLVEARSGYFPPKGGAPEPAAGDTAGLRAKLDAQVVSMTPVAEFPFTVALGQFAKQPNGKTAITVMLHADMKDLPFAMRNNRHTQKLTLVAAVFDENGTMVSAKEGLMDFALSDAKFTSIKGEGVGASLVLEAAPGLYRLCTVGQDEEGKIASTLNKITVP
jgi:VWFA-related protein